MLDNFITVALQVATLFLIMLVGYICGKTKILKENAIKGLTDLVLYVATPAAILQSFANEARTNEKTLNLFYVFIFSVLIHIFTIVFVKLVIRSKDIDTNKILRYSIIFSNCGYMSFPLQKAILGDIGVFYGAVFVAVFNITVWSYGVLLVSGDKKCLSPKKILLNPTIISVVLSILIYLLQIKLPGFLSNAVTHLGNLNTPLPMLIIGYNLSTFGVLKAFTDKRIYLTTMLRLIFVPALSLGVMVVFGISGIPLIACIVAASAPTAANTVMFATKYGLSSELAVKIVSFSTLCSIITMPFFVMLAQSV